MEQNFLYKVDLPFSKKIINFRHLTTKEQLDIEKINLYYPQSVDFYFEFYDSFLRILKGCVENFDEFLEIDLVEFVLFCLKLRVVSIGNVVEFNIKTENESTKNAKITIDLNDLIQNIMTAAVNSLTNYEIIEKDRKITVNIGWPTIKSVPFFYNLYFAEITTHEKVIESIPEFIRSIHLDEKIVNFDNFTHDQKESAFNSFPASLQNKIKDAVLANVGNITNENIFNISYFEEQRFNFYNLFFIEIIKLFYSQNPRRIYEEIYILSNFHMNTNYIMDISPTERKIYLSFIEAQKKSQEPRPENENMGMENDYSNKSVEDLAVEFGDIPPN